MLELYAKMGIELKQFTYNFDVLKTDENQIVDIIRTLLQLPLPRTVKKQTVLIFSVRC
jgi:hypothetical protein